MVWINLGQNRSKWWAVVSTVNDIRVLYRAGNFLTAVRNNINNNNNNIRVKFIFRCSGQPRY